MAQAAVLDPATPPSSALNSTAQGYAAKIGQASEALGPKLEAIGNATDAKVSGIEGERDKLKAPQLQQVPQPVVQSTDPQHVWGSAAMAMAVIGSAMTRQPLTTAMNAAASVLNSFKAGDQARANAAYQTWKVATENAVTQANFERDAYKDAMASLDRREKQATDAMMAEVKSASDAARILAERQRHEDQLAAQAGKLEEQFMGVQALDSLKRTPEWNTQKDPNVPLPVQQFQMMRMALHHTSPTQEAEMIRQARAHRQAILDQMNAYKASIGGYVNPEDKAQAQAMANFAAQLQAADELLADIGPDTGGAAPAPAAAPKAAAPAANAPPAGYPAAKKAPDGHWYIPDPARAGKYLKVG